MSRPIVFGPVAEALFRLEAPTAVSAGAGSGKTTALVELCLRLLEGRALGEPCPPAELAAITFTEKAADELSERLRAAVAERARRASAAGDAPDPEVRRAWLERLAGLDRMAVGTIHGFCGRLLREHAAEAGLDPEFEVADEERTGAWLQAACRAAVVAALDAGEPPVRALAAALGAGSGRTALPAIVAGLVRARATRGDAGPVPLAAADEGAARAARRALLDAAGAFTGAGGQASPSGAAIVDAVARASAALRPEDREGPFTLDGLRRLTALAAAAKGRLKVADGPELKGAQAALREAGEALEPLAAEVLAAPLRAAVGALVEDAERRYAAQKAAARAVDFDDLLGRARDLVARDPALRAELRGRIRALLVDEYQDVNPVQQSIFELLCAPDGAPGASSDAAPGASPEGGARGPVLVAVGDLKQSIYRFRGADVAVFARLIRAFEAGQGRVLNLSENHRSAPAVLDLVNEVSARALQPPPGAAPREDELSFRPEDRLVPRRPEGARPAVELLVDDAGGPSAERRLREARAVAARIQALLSGAAGVAVRERAADGGPERLRVPRAGDVAVLFRRLTQLGPYERALREAGIPFRLARGGGFYQASEVRDLGELLATLSDPGDAVAWAAVLRSPLCAVSDGALLLLAAVGLPRLARLEPAGLEAELERAAGRPAPLPPDEAARLARFLAAWRALRALRDRLPVDALLARAVEALDLDAALLAGPDGERRAANLEKALSLAARFAEGGATAAELAAHLRAQAARPPREPEAELEAGDAVALLSIHQAKGLEWPVVFVPDLGAKAPPDHRRALLDGAGVLSVQLCDPARDGFVDTAATKAARDAGRRAASAESRRLLYVALTRARDQLVLSGERGRNPDTWREQVEAALAARPDLAVRVPIAEAATFASGPALPAEASPAPAPPPAVGPPRLAAPAPVAAVRLAVTDLAELARCPRRHLLGRVLGIAEPRGAPGPAPADDPARATARGTLAHAMLAETDLAAPPLERRAQLAAAAARRGYDPSSKGVRRIGAEVVRFLESPGGKALAAAAREGRVTREVPFLLRLEGDGPPAVYVSGALDALVREKRGELTVVDYKYATPRAGAAERYRLQLLAYVLAASRAHPGRRIRARLQFLRGDHRAVDVTPDEAELRRFEALAPRLARNLLADVEPTPASLGRSLERCREEGCGYVTRCYPRQGG